MNAANVNQIFGRAEAAFASGNLNEARSELVRLRKLIGDHAAVAHLLALVEKKAGNLAASRQSFETALRLTPHDSQIISNYANLLDILGEQDRALTCYEQAIRLAPNFTDARYNRALLLQRLGRHHAALAELEQLVVSRPMDAKMHSARGASLMSLGRIHDASLAYDRALVLAPNRPVALEGRARVAVERGEPGAAVYYRQALSSQPGNLNLLLGLAEALEAEGDAAGIATLEGAVARHPEWILGHETLSRMRAEAAEQDFSRSYREAIAALPGHLELHRSHWRTLARATRYQDALAALRAASESIPRDRDTMLMEAVFCSQVGEVERADHLFGQLGAGRDVQLARGRHALRLGNADQAAKLLSAVVAETPEDVVAWAHLGIAWRVMDDPAFEWLCLQPGLFGFQDLEITDAELRQLSMILRGLHRMRAHPLGQSLRGGTQTRGRLFWRLEPELAQLSSRLDSAVQAHIDALPPPDPNHPLLRHRARRFTFDGSWSVRLTDSGFHVPHIHPKGILSSACYIAVPETLGTGESRHGWLELGAPPQELELGLPPLAMIEPRPGRLALFPSYFYHGTRPFPAGERLSVAFDVVPA